MCGVSEGVQEIQYYFNEEENIPTGEGEGNIVLHCIARHFVYLNSYL